MPADRRRLSVHKIASERGRGKTYRPPTNGWRQERRSGRLPITRRLLVMTVVGIAIGTGTVHISITVTSLFLSTVSGGASTHGITIPTTDTVIPITRMTTPMIT